MGEIEIRDFEILSDYDKCVELQIAVWGLSEVEAIPAIQLIVAHRYGGHCIGAFHGEKIVGFVYGMVGNKDGKVFHHSHMLGVSPPYRGRGIGEELKWAQRDRVLGQGLDLITWTFDPLQAPNANLNINHLGVEVFEYIENIYGEGTSPIHGAMPTDRFEAEWWLESTRVANARKGSMPESKGWEELPRVNRIEWKGELPRYKELELERDEAVTLVEIPLDMTSVIASSPELALDWRMKTRRLFQKYFSRGYAVAGFHRSEGRAFYRLSHRHGRRLRKGN